jgi:hypothetical protein
MQHRNPMGASAMLKQLNGIAAGLLGLHGYPVESFSRSPTRQSPTPANQAGRGAASPRAAEPVAREPAPIDAALHC